MRKIVTLLLISILSFPICLTKGLVSLSIVQASVSVYPSYVIPGNEGYVQLTLKNSGSSVVTGIKISQVSFDKTIIPSGSWVGELNPLGIGDSAIYLFKFKVSENALPGLYTITFYIDYNTDSTTKTIKQIAIVNVQSPSALEIISVEPYSLKAGEKVEMKFTLTNKGSNQINNIIFTWSSQGNIILPVGSGNRIFIPSIEGNSNYEIKTEVSVSPSITPGIYPLNVLIQYTDKTGANQTINLIVGIEVSSETDFDVSVEEMTSSSLTLAVANTGAYTAYSVIVKIPSQENLRVIGSSSSILGNLNAGDYTLATFQIFIPNFTANFTGEIPQPARNFTRPGSFIVEISYTDALGIRRVVKKEVEIGFFGAKIPLAVRTPLSRNQQGVLTPGLIYIIIGVVGIILVVVTVKLRRRIQRKRE
ncbi:MAG: hypothetical protein NZ942_02835 [Candidatus Aenigmarchaeota archaeon]|nr:hypothetical protein [Candidatus Aenigmarchaeota archaeon]